MFKRSPFCQTSSTYITSSVAIPNHSYHLNYLLFHVDDVGFLMAIIWWITSCQLQLIIREGDLETFVQYLGACIPQWKFLRIRWKVHNIGLRSSDSMGVRHQITIHIPWIVPIVPWEPLSLLMVSLMPINKFHHWLVIRWLYCMFDFNSHIHMLELVLVWVEEHKTLGFFW